MSLEWCLCKTCNLVLKVADCIPDFGNHDGWELPPSTIHYCPYCDGGAIEDYFYSQQSAAAVQAGFQGEQ